MKKASSNLKVVQSYLYRAVPCIFDSGGSGLVTEYVEPFHKHGDEHEHVPIIKELVEEAHMALPF